MQHLIIFDDIDYNAMLKRMESTMDITGPCVSQEIIWRTVKHNVCKTEVLVMATHEMRA